MLIQHFGEPKLTWTDTSFHFFRVNKLFCCAFPLLFALLCFTSVRRCHCRHRPSRPAPPSSKSVLDPHCLANTTIAAPSLYMCAHARVRGYDRYREAFISVFTHLEFERDTEGWGERYDMDAIVHKLESSIWRRCPRRMTLISFYAELLLLDW